MQSVDTARIFADCKAGNKMAARMAMMAMTTNNSINVNPRGRISPSFLLALVIFIFIRMFHFARPTVLLFSWAGVG